VALEDRIGILQVVAVAVVEGEADEFAPEDPLSEAPAHLVEGDEVDVGAAQAHDHVFQKGRRHFEQVVGLEGARPRRTHVVQRNDRPDAGEKRPQRQIGPGEIERFEPGSGSAAFSPGPRSRSHSAVAGLCPSVG